MSFIRKVVGGDSVTTPNIGLFSCSLVRNIADTDPKSRKKAAREGSTCVIHIQN